MQPEGLFRVIHNSIPFHVSSRSRARDFLPYRYYTGSDKNRNRFLLPSPTFLSPGAGGLLVHLSRPAGKISGAGGAPPRLRRPKQVPVREKTKKITFLLFFQGKIYYTIKDCIRTASRALAHGVFQPLAFFREEAACFGAATDEKYGLPTAICMVVGIVIGSGIFFKAEKILNATGGDLRTGILAWIIGGLIAISNACAFAVMATRYQKVGGMVDYAEAAVGRAYGYYLGWFLAAVYYPCLTSTLAWVSARYTCVLLGYDIVSGECMTITPVLSGGRLLPSTPWPPSGRQAPGLHDPHQAGPHPAHGRDGHCGRAAERHDRRQLRPGHRRHRYRLPPSSPPWPPRPSPMRAGWWPPPSTRSSRTRSAPCPWPWSAGWASSC